MLDAVRDHNLIAFRQAWKRFKVAVPGSLRLVPQAELRAVIEDDYGAMEGMILGDAPGFDWIMEQPRLRSTQWGPRESPGPQHDARVGSWNESYISQRAPGPQRDWGRPDPHATQFDAIGVPKSEHLQLSR